MSQATAICGAETSGNSAEDWKIFEVLCGVTAETSSASRLHSQPMFIEGDPCTSVTTTTAATDHHHHGLPTDIDLVTALRSELAALTYKRDHLSTELADTKNTLCCREAECESLRAQAARQSALISSLQARLQAAENREHFAQTRCDCVIETIKREQRTADEHCKELQQKVQHLETLLASEESRRQQLKSQLRHLLQRLSTSLGLDVCESVGELSSAECVAARVDELMTELQRHKAKINATCDTLASCENELLHLKSLTNIEKQRVKAQLESCGNHVQELESRCGQYERDLQLQRDRFAESERNAEQLKEELRGFESRCQRLQNKLDRCQSDRLQFLRSLATQLNVPDPCETLIKDKLMETLRENRSMNVSIQDQLSSTNDKLRDTEHSNQTRLSQEEAQKRLLEEQLENCRAEILTLRKDHLGLSEYLHRLDRALNWHDSATPPALGNDTNMLAESILERIEHLTQQLNGLGIDAHACLHDHQSQTCCERHHHHHQHHPHQPYTSLRRENSCQDIALKESSSVYTLQRRVRILREQVQRRDMHLELLKRKLAIIEDGSRRKCILQAERDEAAHRTAQANKQIDKLTAQLLEARTQIAEVKAQLAESVDYKITALERARKIDELAAKLSVLEEDKTRLLSQLSAGKERLKLSTESAQNRRCRDEMLINSLREDVTRLQTQLTDTNHRLSRLQSFRTSVARTLHLRDLPETDLLQRLQALCSAHQEFTLLSKRYESVSPVADHACPRYEDTMPLPTTHCRPPHDECPANCAHHHHHHEFHHGCQRHHSLKEKHRRQRKKNHPSDKPGDEYPLSGNDFEFDRNKSDT